MEIPQKLLKFKYHFLAALVLGFALFSVTLLAPRFLTVLAYFWPLFLSTALFLALVLLFGRTSSIPAANTGEVFLDYVAGHPEPPLDSHATKSD